MSEVNFKVTDLGRMDYSSALEKQEDLFNRMLHAKSDSTELPANELFLVEHDPVYTLGKSGDMKNLKREPKEVGASFFKTSRGGDITYHGPGQIVGYPIFDLESFDMGIADYIEALEEVIIETISEYGLKGGRIKEASGVWLDWDNDKARKICAIGVKASRYVTMHGFAFNVTTDLTYFDHIIPCGIDDKDVTSIEKELGTSVSLEEIKKVLISKFKTVFR